MSDPLRTEGLYRSFDDGNRVIEVLRGVDVVLGEGERIAVVGPSGCGKSTLLHLMGLLDTPTGGAVFLGDDCVSDLDDSARAEIRNQRIGFVYQAYHLLPEFTAIENVTIPAQMMGVKQWRASRDEIRDRAALLLDQVGLSDRLGAYPATLSGGEKQRVAIARALINDPQILLCDEPTGNLDEKTSAEIFELLGRIHESRGYSAVIVTHEIGLARQCDRVIRLEDGVLRDD